MLDSRNRLLTTALAGLALCVPATLVPSVAHAGSGGPTRVLIEGDSITHGLNGDYTWRYWLWREFRRQHVEVDFVGSRSLPYVRPGYPTAVYADPAFDSDHFSTLGTRIQNEVGRIGAEVTQQRPDVVVFACGLNDLHGGASPEETAQHLRQWIAQVRAAKPDTMMVVSPVLEIRRDDLPWMPATATRYNDLAAGVVAELSSSQSPVVMADTTRGWEPTPFYSTDGVHATPTGETLIAQRVAESLEGLGVLPADPEVDHGFQPWERHLQPVVSLRRGGAFVTWDHQALSGAKIWIRRRPAGWRALPRTVQWSLRTGALTPGATYDVRLQGVRRELVSTPGPVATVTAPPLARVHRVVVGRTRLHWSAVRGATAYRVQFRRPHRRAWTFRTVRGTSLGVRAVVARVRARNAFGVAPATSGRRG